LTEGHKISTLANSTNFQEELEWLKSIIRKTVLKETIKWGTEVYTHNGKNVLGLVAFKNFFSLWFYNGVFLEDKHKVLINANEEKTKALRQWRFTSKEEIKEDLILQYVNEAIQNEEVGKIWKPQKSKAPEIPSLLKAAFDKDKKLKSAFEKLSPYKQKEFIEHISSAKRDATKQCRLEKAVPMILKGVGLHDKYR